MIERSQLPEWVQERALYIFAGIELLAYQLPEESWWVKTGRCSQCGKCCQKFKESPFGLGPPCPMLTEVANEWRCSLLINRPFGCCVGISSLPECSEQFEAMK